MQSVALIAGLLAVSLLVCALSLGLTFESPTYATLAPEPATAPTHGKAQLSGTDSDEPSVGRSRNVTVTAPSQVLPCFRVCA